MSDYLTSLAARAVDAAAAIRPRLASVYEPRAFTEASTELETAPAPNEAPRAHLVSPAPEPVTRHDPAPPRAEIVRETTEKRVEVTHETEKRVVTEATPTPTPREVVVRERMPSPVPPLPPIRASEPASTPNREPSRPTTQQVTNVPPRERAPERATPAIVERLRETALPPREQRTIVERHVETRTIEPPMPPRITVPVPRASVEQPPPTPIAIARDIVAETQHPQPSAPITVAPRIVAQPKPLIVEKPVPNEPQADAGPSIHVTIGRIEVRAVPAEEPPRRAAVPAERVSLDDYLRRRAERPRR